MDIGETKRVIEVLPEDEPVFIPQEEPVGVPEEVGVPEGVPASN